MFHPIKSLEISRHVVKPIRLQVIQMQIGQTRHTFFNSTLAKCWAISLPSWWSAAETGLNSVGLEMLRCFHHINSQQQTTGRPAGRCGEALFLHIDDQSGRASRDSSLLLHRSPCCKNASRNISRVYVHNPTYTILMGDHECLREGHQRKCLESFSPCDNAGVTAFWRNYSLSSGGGWGGEMTTQLEYQQPNNCVTRRKKNHTQL